MKTVATNITAYVAEKPNHRIVGWWLIAMCAMVFVMIIIGGVTRLTHSGLSMVVWRPITGWLPPFTPAEWKEVFLLYMDTPEFKKVNSEMTIDAFKSIFWLEYLHRVWGRIIGITFLVPFIYFLIKGSLGGVLVSKLIFIFALGMVQGFLGWYMVLSGLAERPDVSQYRLTAHLGVAILIYAYMFWVALGQLYDRSLRTPKINKGIQRLTVAVVILLTLTMLAGGLVAGLDAGFTYNTFPLMDGRLIPLGLLQMSPLHINIFENIVTVQFDHRLMAKISLVLTALLWWQACKKLKSEGALWPFHLLGILILIQFCLGILTLIFVVPIPLAVAHQAGAFMSLTAGLWALNGLSYRRRVNR